MSLRLLFLFPIYFIVLLGPLNAGEVYVLEKRHVTVLFESPLKMAATEIADIYPDVKANLEGIFGWDLNTKPSVLLIKNRRNFQRMAESPLTVAFAVPGKNLIAIDYSRMNTHPFSLENILKHELCHLLLHHHIKGRLLPRWLDEGVAQWVSDGISDVIMDQKRSILNRVAFNGRFIPLNSLQKGFPTDNESLLLAYEESKSFVVYIISKSGKEGILRVLEYMKNGDNADEAILKALSVPLENLEKEWHRSLRQKITWLTYLSYHLYDILFVLMAVITIWAFIRMMIRKRKYTDEETDISP